MGEPERAEGVQRPYRNWRIKWRYALNRIKGGTFMPGIQPPVDGGEASHSSSFDPDASGHAKAFVSTSFESCLETFFLFCVTNQM